MPRVDMTETGKRIKGMCDDRGMTAVDVAQAVGVTTVAVYKWFRGASVPSIDNVVVIAAMFGAKIDDVIAVAT